MGITKLRQAAALQRALAIVIVAVTCTTFNGGISIGASNHAGLLPVVRRILDPNYLPNDFNIGLRLYHHRTFAYLLAGLSSLFGEDFAVITLHGIGALLMATALWYLCATLRLSSLSYLALGAALATGFLWTGWGLEENDFIGNPEIQPPIFAHSFALFAAALLMQRRYQLAAFCAGCVVFFHLQIGVIVTLMMAPLFVGQVLNLPYRLRNFFKLAGCYLLPALPALFHLFGMLQRGLFKPAASAVTLADYIDFRHPHHFALISPTHALWVVAHLIILSSLWLWLRKRKDAMTHAVSVMTMMSLSLIALSLLHFADYYLMRQGKFANLQSIRVSPLITVFGTTALLIWLEHVVPASAGMSRWQITWLKRERFRLKPVLHALMIATAFFWGYRGTQHPDARFHFGVTRYRDVSDKRGARKQWIDVCNWIRAHGARDTVYLTPPAYDGFTSLTDRSNVVEFKINPDGALHLSEWYERLSDVTGNRLPRERGLDNREPLNKAYAALDAEQFIALANKYRAAFAIVPKNAKLPFTTLYENERFKLVKLVSEARP